MEKRVIIAFILSFAVLYVFTRYFSPTPSPELPGSVQTQQPSAPAPVSPSAAAPAEQRENPSETAVENVQAEKSEDFTFETPLYTATFSNVGGVLKSYRLKEYSDGEGHPLELI